jgi:hypothetical protein
VTPASPIAALALPTPISRKLTAVEPYLYIFWADTMFKAKNKIII